MAQAASPAELIRRYSGHFARGEVPDELAQVAKKKLERSESETQKILDGLQQFAKLADCSSEQLLELVHKAHTLLCGKEEGLRTVYLFSITELPKDFIELDARGQKRALAARVASAFNKRNLNGTEANLKADWERWSCCGGSSKAGFLAMMAQATYQKDGSWTHANPSDFRGLLELLGKVQMPPDQLANAMKECTDQLYRQLHSKVVKPDPQETADWAQREIKRICPFSTMNERTAEIVHTFILRNLSPKGVQQQAPK
jgi:hypothetical protein